MMSPAEGLADTASYDEESNELNLIIPYSLKLIPAPMVSPPYSLK
jgi:hypothetical protein